jgi:hypothetical protein
MRYPIDVMFVNRQGLVMKTAANLAAWRGALCLGSE